MDPVLGEDEVGKLTAKLGQTASQHKGKILKEDKLGRKRLAYPIRKKMEGTYVCLHVDLPSASLADWQRSLRLEPAVMRQMTLQQEKS